MMTWLMAAGSLYVLVALLVYALQGQMVYHPGSRQHAGSPRLVGLDYEDFELEVERGVVVHGWLVPPPAETPLDGVQAEPPLWVHFSHGNAGNISHRLETLQILHGLGLGVCIYDYRGYGKSTGHTDVPGTFSDAAAVWKMLTQKVPQERIILWGRSLGGAVAARLAASLHEKGQNPAALVLESTFTSVVAMGKKSYPFLPVRLLCRYPYDTLALIDSVEAPLLVIHSEGDDIVPGEMGRKIFDAAQPPKEFLEIHGDHNRGFLESGEVYTQGVRRFLEEYVN